MSDIWQDNPRRGMRWTPEDRRRPLVLATHGGDHWENRIWGSHKDPPTTPMQALMEAAAHDEPEESSLEKRVRMEWVHQLIEDAGLTDRELYVLENLYWGRMPLRMVAKNIHCGKTTVARVRDSAVKKLRLAAEALP